MITLNGAKCTLYTNKGEAIQKFIEYKNMVETHTGRKIKAIQSNDGHEYCNKQIDNFLKSAGIEHRLTIPHMPQQNGIAERKNCLLLEIAHCLLA